jgi:hypothetical protein
VSQLSFAPPTRCIICDADLLGDARWVVVFKSWDGSCDPVCAACWRRVMRWAVAGGEMAVS